MSYADPLSRQATGALLLAPLGALANSFAGLSIADQDPRVLGAIAGAGAGYLYGDRFVDFSASGYGSLKAHDVVMLASAAALGYMVAPQLGFSPLMGAAAGGALGFAANKMISMPAASQ